jgi:hypothetical protein
MEPFVLLSATLNNKGHLVVRWAPSADLTFTQIVWSRSPAVAPEEAGCHSGRALKEPPGSGSQFVREPVRGTTFTSSAVLEPGTWYVQIRADNRQCFNASPFYSNIVRLDVPSKTTKPSGVVVPSPAREIVDLASVSNGCGGGEAGTSPRFLDEVTFDSGTKGLRFKVRFRQACNVHDAGYGGVVIRDPLHANKVVDFRTWTRKQVDDKFHTDLKQLCAEQIPAQGAGAAALKKCQAYADAYWAGVRTFGWTFFDADAQAPGDQSSGPRCKGRSSKLC